MDEFPRKLVIRSLSPGRRWLALSTALLLGLVACYLTFEVGRYLGGYDAVRAAAERSAMQHELTELRLADHQLRVDLAAAQEAQVADGQERSEVSRTIGELQAQVQRQQQDVEFYRGMLTPQTAPQVRVGVRVQQFHISVLPVAQKFVLRFVLNQGMAQPERAIDGTLAITVEGTQGGKPGSVDLTALTAGQHDLPFNFRYYANIEQPITLPVAFKPDSVTIEVRPARKDMAPYRQTFLWEVDPT